MKTEDGGINWKNTRKIEGKTVSRVQFVDEEHGWIYSYSDADGKNYLMRTTDGGENGTVIKIPDPNFAGGNLGLAYSFISPNEGWLITGSQPGAGQQGKNLYKTMDGGKNWDMIASCGIQSAQINGLPSGGYVGDLFFLNEEYGWFTESRGQLFVTTDGGKDWVMVDNHPVDERFIAKPFFINLNEGYVLNSVSGINSLLATKDGGVSWKQVYP